MNIAAAVVMPVGLFLYCRMWSFRLRLHHDLQAIRSANEMIVQEVGKMNA